MTTDIRDWVVTVNLRDRRTVESPELTKEEAEKDLATITNALKAPGARLPISLSWGTFVRGEVVSAVLSERPGPFVG